MFAFAGRPLKMDYGEGFPDVRPDDVTLCIPFAVCHLSFTSY